MTSITAMTFAANKTPCQIATASAATSDTTHATMMPISQTTYTTTVTASNKPSVTAHARNRSDRCGAAVEATRRGVGTITGGGYG